MMFHVRIIIFKHIFNVLPDSSVWCTNAMKWVLFVFVIEILKVIIWYSFHVESNDSNTII